MTDFSNSLNPVSLTRRSSEETISPDDLTHELATLQSGSSTMVDSAFGNSINEFNHIRTLPIVSSLFKKGVYVFPSEDALLMYKNKQIDTAKGTGVPLFKAIQPSSLGFKKSNVIMTFYKYKGSNEKFVYCRVFMKNMREQYGVIRYTFKFSPNGFEDNDPDAFEVVMFSATNAPVNDCKFRGTKLRWIGSTLAEPLKSFKLLVLNKDIPSFCDDVNEKDPLPNAEAKVDFTLKSTDFPPLARFVEHRPASKTGLVQTADMKVIEVFNGTNKDSVDDVSDVSLVTICMALLLEEQRKNMGNSKSYDTTMFS